MTLSEQDVVLEGTRVRVVDDATMWGNPTAGPSVCRGHEGVVRLHPRSDYERRLGLQGYDCWLEGGESDGARFFFRELEVIE